MTTTSTVIQKIGTKTSSENLRIRLARTMGGEALIENSHEAQLYRGRIEEMNMSYNGANSFNIILRFTWLLKQAENGGWEEIENRPYCIRVSASGRSAFYEEKASDGAVRFRSASIYTCDAISLYPAVIEPTNRPRRDRTGTNRILLR